MRPSSYRPLSLLAAGALVTGLSFAPSAANAWDQRVEDGVRHFVECFKFMLTDEPSHIAFCSPSRAGEWFIPESNYSAPPPPKDECEDGYLYEGVCYEYI